MSLIMYGLLVATLVSVFASAVNFGNGKPDVGYNYGAIALALMIVALIYGYSP